MSRAESNWERLVKAALARDRIGGSSLARPGGGFGDAPTSLGNKLHIDEILRAADEIQDEDANISRILCEHAYSLAQNLDPNSERRGVLQFKTGLMSIIRQKLAKREGGPIDRSQDIIRLQEFYKLYRERNRVDELRDDENKLRESGAFTGRQIRELERKTVKRKKIFATLNVFGTVLEELMKEISPEDAEKLMSEELTRMIKSDADLSEDVVAYNIIPLDSQSTTNEIISLPEVRAAVSSLKHFPHLPKLPSIRDADMLDFLQYVFGFQKDNISNQREHIILLLANEQSSLDTPVNDASLDERAVSNVFQTSLGNYFSWCRYLGGENSRLHPVVDRGSLREEKLLYVSLYFLIWGEAANVRFLPECLCYIFHQMAKELQEILRLETAQKAASCKTDNGASFLDQVISPLYKVASAEAENNNNGRASHSSWRNYDDFNEYFWSFHCFRLKWPWNLTSPFFQQPKPKKKGLLCIAGSSHHGKTSFVEHRTFLHLYHSFHRLWIFLFLMFQGMTIIAFNDGHFNMKTWRAVLSLGPTFVVMMLVESALDVLMMFGAYSTSDRFAVARIFCRLIWFSTASLVFCFLYIKALQEGTSSAIFNIYLFVLAIYAGIQLIISFFMRIPICRGITEKCDGGPLMRFIKWMYQEHHFLGRGMYERTSDFIKYASFWLVVLGAKFSFGYFLLIKPLVPPTRIIIHLDHHLVYSWHDLVSQNNHNALTVLSLWAPVFVVYLLDIHIFYTVFSAVIGFLLGARDRLGEIRSIEALHELFKGFPKAFVKKLHFVVPERKDATMPMPTPTTTPASSLAPIPKYEEILNAEKLDAAKFAPFWNEIIRNLREEDYVNNTEMDLLLMPKNTSILPLVQWPLFLLSSKIFLARDIAIQNRDDQEGLWKKISEDEYMKYAVEECFHSIILILTSILDSDTEGKIWVELMREAIKESIDNKKITVDCQLSKLPLVITRITAITGVLKNKESPELLNGAIKAIQDLFDVFQHDVFSFDVRSNQDRWATIRAAKAEGYLFSKLKWPVDPELKTHIKRLHSIMTIKESAANIPKNLEARRRLQFFTNSLFMNMPSAKPVRGMMSFSVLTPYYSEIVLYSIKDLRDKNEDGISTLFYLQKIFPGGRLDEVDEFDTTTFTFIVEDSD